MLFCFNATSQSTLDTLQDRYIMIPSVYDIEGEFQFQKENRPQILFFEYVIDKEEFFSGIKDSLVSRTDLNGYFEIYNMEDGNSTYELGFYENGEMLKGIKIGSDSITCIDWGYECPEKLESIEFER